jgi:cytidylate kinase
MKIEHTRSIEQIIEEQIKKWEAALQDKKKTPTSFPTITVSRQAGSGGHILAPRLAKDLGLDFFDQEIIQAIADNAHIRTSVVRTLDEKSVSAIESMFSAITGEQHLWRYEYLDHLVKVIVAIGKHGHAVILGRGANFILPQEDILRVRIVAPLEVRIKNTAAWLNLSLAEAKKQVLKVESDRIAFIRKYFNVDIDDPVNNDIIINTKNTSIDAAVDIVKAALKFKYGGGKTSN